MKATKTAVDCRSLLYWSVWRSVFGLVGKLTAVVSDGGVDVAA